MSELVDVEKLLKFAGFKLCDCKRCSKGGDFYSNPFYVYPDGNAHEPPDFRDLKECFKWLVPKVLEEYNIESYCFKQHDDWYYSETNIWRKGSTKHNLEVLHDEHIAKDFEQGTDLEKITALAFCKAVEELINAEVKDAGDGEAGEQALATNQAEDQR